MSDPSPQPGSPAEPALKSGARSARPIALGLLALVLAIGGYMYWRAPQPEPSEPELVARSVLQLDLVRPDALIESASLARLPRDLLQVPLLKDLLTEDFVFYYESNADRLGIAGSLRRIAYEHDLALRDTIIAELLDEPAEIALWRGADGKLGNAILRLRRGAIARALQPLLQAAAEDTQLRRIGDLQIDGDTASIFRLRYNYDRALIFVPYEDQMLVLTSADMLQSGGTPDSPLGRTETEQLQALLAGTASFAPRFGLDARTAIHRLTLSADYLAFGYGRFVPQLAGLRMEMDDAGWHSFLAMNGDATEAQQFEPLWQAMPMGASFCAAVPVSIDTLKPLFAKLSEQQALPAELATQLDGPAALCWYGKSRLHTPLLVGRLHQPGDASVDAHLAHAFTAMIGSYEPNAAGGAFPVDQQPNAAGTTWQRIVGSSFGLHPASELPEGVAITGDGFFRIALARHGDTLLFSLDDSLVAHALETLDKHFPPLAEQLPKDAWVSAYIASTPLAALLEQEVLSALPSDSEAVFRNAAENHLLPKLRSMGAHGNYVVSLPPTARANGDWTWYPLQWTAL